MNITSAARLRSIANTAAEVAWQDMYAKRRRPRKTMGQPNRSACTMNGQKYHGERKTLEAAFKATTNLIYKHAREYWLKMDARTVTPHFADFLKEETI